MNYFYLDYFIYIFLGIIPAFLWLLYFLRKDDHPESIRVILKIFFFGILVAIPTVIIQFGLSKILENLVAPQFLREIIYIFLAIAFIEEFMKYLAVKEKALSDPEFDEPIDIMMYMIIAALGFASIENVLYLLNLNFKEAIAISSFRAFGAILLHALSSATLGYFIALSFFKPKEKTKFFLIGILSATLLHGFFNFSIIKLNGIIKLFIPFVILIFLIFVITAGMQNLKKIKSICET